MSPTYTPVPAVEALYLTRRNPYASGLIRSGIIRVNIRSESRYAVISRNATTGQVLCDTSNLLHHILGQYEFQKAVLPSGSDVKLCIIDKKRTPYAWSDKADIDILTETVGTQDGGARP